MLGSVLNKNNLNFISENQVKVRIKCIAIAKCDLFSHYRDAKVISFYYFRDTKLCAKHEKMYVDFMYVVGIMFLR